MPENIMHPTFSVVVPVYNVEPYIIECLNSVQNQTYDDFECILVDDGSTDKSGEICEKYSAIDTRFICIHKINGGLSDARNVGTESAQGRYVLYLDSDDYLSKDALQIFFNAIKKFEYPDLVCLGLESFGLSKCYYPFVDKQLVVKGNHNIQQSYFDRKWYEMAWNKAIRRDLIKENGLFFEKGIKHEDTLWSFLVAMNIESLVLIPHISYFYRLRPNSIVTTLGGMENENQILFVVDRMVEYTKKHINTNRETYYYLIDLITDHVLQIVQDKSLTKASKQEICELFLAHLRKVYLLSFISSKYSFGKKVYSIAAIMPPKMGSKFITEVSHTPRSS